MAYMAIGWRIGLGFDKQILLRALRPLPQILLSIFALLAICAGMAWGLTRFMHIDFMTAYLATSPGGLDTVAVIAAGSNADMALIMAMQTLRLFSILLTGACHRTVYFNLCAEAFGLVLAARAPVKRAR